ncbi:sterile alpha motif domain-containing protein 1-like [Moschus berezovskii]|uniref:sterile alpha motif domain-containing protein 1-like n=1 Tax=Moschus berezovskii TaxID=68408 RepID=UPI002444664B|nr:sterile alpha motif domain-containing protein 1-like [Moschus berezovskii]
MDRKRRFRAARGCFRATWSGGRWPPLSRSPEGPSAPGPRPPPARGALRLGPRGRVMDGRGAGGLSGLIDEVRADSRRVSRGGGRRARGGRRAQTPRRSGSAPGRPPPPRGAPRIGSAEGAAGAEALPQPGARRAAPLPPGCRPASRPRSPRPFPRPTPQPPGPRPRARRSALTRQPRSVPGCEPGARPLQPRTGGEERLCPRRGRANFFSELALNPNSCRYSHSILGSRGQLGLRSDQRQTRARGHTTARACGLGFQEVRLRGVPRA